MSMIRSTGHPGTRAAGGHDPAGLTSAVRQAFAAGSCIQHEFLYALGGRSGPVRPAGGCCRHRDRPLPAAACRLDRPGCFAARKLVVYLQDIYPDVAVAVGKVHEGVLTRTAAATVVDRLPSGRPDHRPQRGHAPAVHSQRGTGREVPDRPQLGRYRDRVPRQGAQRVPPGPWLRPAVRGDVLGQSRSGAYARPDLDAAAKLEQSRPHVAVRVRGRRRAEAPYDTAGGRGTRD